MNTRAVATLALLGFFAAGANTARPGPTLTCKGWRSPRIVCEARFVWPYEPDWTVWEGDDRRDVDHGLIVYLTVPEYRFARVEMCPLPDVCVSAWAGWFNRKALFHE